MKEEIRMSCKQCMSGVRGSGTMCSDRVDYSRVTGVPGRNGPGIFNVAGFEKRCEKT